jgi:hypothetical protein
MPAIHEDVGTDMYPLARNGETEYCCERLAAVASTRLPDATDDRPGFKVRAGQALVN